MKNRYLLSSLLTILSISSASAASIYWRASTGDVGYTGNYLEGSNYDGTAPQAGDDVFLTANNVTDGTVIYLNQAAPEANNITFRDRGAIFQIRSGGSLIAGETFFQNHYEQGDFTLSIQGGSFTTNNLAPAARHTISVSSGTLNLSDPGSGSSGLFLDGGGVLNLSGGTIDMGGLRVSIQEGNSGTGINWTGGEMLNVDRFMGDNVNAQTVVNGGGTLYVNNSIRTDDLASYSNGTGRLVFAINSDGSTDAELSQYSNGGIWDLSSGEIAIDFGTYMPQVGDSWDFTSLGGGDFISNAANIASLSHDGDWLIDWDTANWPNGELGINGVTAVPEPATTAMLLALGVFAGVVYRRRKQR